MASYTVIHERPEAFYETFERKGELHHQTHYCPGCGHGIVSKLLARAIDELGVQDRTVLIKTGSKMITASRGVSRSAAHSNALTAPAPKPMPATCDASA